jgi:hypothetical protein
VPDAAVDLVLAAIAVIIVAARLAEEPRERVRPENPPTCPRFT